MSDFAKLTVKVAKHFWGEPNPDLSTPTKLRWGNKGARCVDVKKGVWQDWGVGGKKGEGGGCLALIRRETGLATDREAVEWLKQHDYDLPEGTGYKRPPQWEIDAADRERTQFALRWHWHPAKPARGTIVETYLRNRALLIDDVAPDVLRYLANCRFGDETHPAMIGLFRDIMSNQPRAVHCTALLPDGSDRVRQRRDGTPWEGKKMQGPVKGCVIKLHPNDAVRTVIGVGEGIESTLSLRHLTDFGCKPVWATGCAASLKKFPVLGSVETLWVAVDQDEAGHEASEAVADRWTAAGREVFLVNPRKGKDVNDVIRGWSNG